MANNDDFTKSLIEDLKRAGVGDATLLKKESEEASQREFKRKVEELQQMFPQLAKEELEQALRENKGDVDKAILPLFVRGEELRKKKEEEERKKRNLAQMEHQIKELTEAFKQLPKDKIQQTFEENEGDIGATTTALVDMVIKMDEKKKTIKLEALRQKFPELPEKQITTALESAQWDLQKANLSLLKSVRELHKKELQRLFQSLSEFEIDQVFAATGYEKAKTVEKLTEVCRRKEEEERLRLERERLENEKLQEHERQKKREQERKEKELEKEVKLKQEAEQRKEIEKRAEQDLLHQSLIITNDIEKKTEEIRKEERERLEEKLKTIVAGQADLLMNRDPFTSAPLNVKEINQITGKTSENTNNNNNNVPFVESVQKTSENNAQKPPSEALPPTSTQSMVVEQQKNSDPNAMSVKLTLISSAIVDVGQPIVVEYEILKGKSTTSDWVGLFHGTPLEKGNKEYVTYNWRPNATKENEVKGRITFIAPSTYGSYQIRYFPSRQYEFVAVSETIKLGPVVHMTASFVIDSDVKSSSTSSSSSLTSTNNNNTNNTSNTTNNNNSNGLVTVYAASVGGTGSTARVRVTWQQATGNTLPTSAWVGLYFKNQSNNRKMLAWQKAAQLTLFFDAPLKPGEYEFRFFPSDYHSVSSSNSLLVTGQDSIEAHVKEGKVHIDLNLVSVDPATDNVWVGLYFVHEPHNNQWRRCKWVRDRRTTLLFHNTPRTEGVYEARLFACGSYNCVLKSKQFSLPNAK